MVRLCFRFDDPSATSNHALERAILTTFARREIPLTIAVIPFRRVGEETVALGVEHVGHLIDAQSGGAVEVAQHGLMHLRRAATPAGKPSEFHSLPDAEQREMIERGGERLREVFGRQTVGFVPPWNSYDANTVAALEELGYRYVSAAWDFPCLSRAIATLPLTCWLKNVREAIAEARRFVALNPLVVAVFHHYDFKESGEESAYLTIEALGELLDWVRSAAQVEPLTLADALENRLAFDLGVRCHAWRNRLPWRLRFLLPQHALLSSPLSRRRENGTRRHDAR